MSLSIKGPITVSEWREFCEDYLGPCCEVQSEEDSGGCCRPECMTEEECTNEPEAGILEKPVNVSDVDLRLKYVAWLESQDQDKSHKYSVAENVPLNELWVIIDNVD